MGELRRICEVISLMPFSLSYTGGLYSAKTIRQLPFWFKRGSIPEVVFSPRVSVNRICASLKKLFAFKVLKMASRINAEEGISANANVCAEACKRSMCSFKQ